MKKILSTSILMTAINVFACWFTQENFNNAYIAGVNYFNSHYTKVNSLENAQYNNGQNVSLPLTVWFKVSPRTFYVDGQIQTDEIRVAKLYYKILPGGVQNANCKWRLVKSINLGSNPRWKMDFKEPVKLFGNNVITMSLINSKGDTLNKNDHIILAWYIAGSSPDCITSSQDITDGSHEPVITIQNTENYSKEHAKSFKPAFIMRVIYNGKKTPSR